MIRCKEKMEWFAFVFYHCSDNNSYYNVHHNNSNFSCNSCGNRIYGDCFRHLLTDILDKLNIF